MQITISLRNGGHLTCLRWYQSAVIIAEYQLNTAVNVKESESFLAYLSSST